MNETGHGGGQMGLRILHNEFMEWMICIASVHRQGQFGIWERVGKEFKNIDHLELLVLCTSIIHVFCWTERKDFYVALVY